MATDGNPADVGAPVRAPAPGSTRVVLLDALGTLIGLEPPAPHLVHALAACGVDIPLRDAVGALRAEMAYYRAEHHRARTPFALMRLRQRCAAIVREALGLAPAAITDEALCEVLVASFRFFVYADVPPVLRELRRRGVRLVICSNWDVSLLEILLTTGLGALVDGVVVSAVEGVAKPDARIFVRALEVAGGVAAGSALHVGDSVAADVRGALGAGIAPVRIARAGAQLRSHDEDDGCAPTTAVITDLRGLLTLV